MRRFVLGGLVVAACASSGCRGGAFTVYEENDKYSLVGARDRYYTQGLRTSLVGPAEETPDLARAVAERIAPDGDDDDAADVRPAGIVLGQNIYTPRNIRENPPLAGDRPYCGWLYVGGVVADQRFPKSSRVGDDQRTLELDVGTVGPPSLGDSIQTHWHEWIHVPIPLGWSHQIRTEPAFVLTYERRNRIAAGEAPLDAQWDAIPGYVGAVGNFETHAAVELTVRGGWNLPRDFGVNTISTTAMETTDPKNGVHPSFYFFGGTEGRAVLRNLTLDGNTFESSAHVDKFPAVCEFRVGAALQFGRFRVTYAWITRSMEFHGQAGWTRYGSLSATWLMEF